jgi:hypothetical protein
MGYIQDFEVALRSKLDALDTGDEQAVADFVKWTKGEILRSYKNGLDATNRRPDKAERTRTRSKGARDEQ